MAYNIDNIIVNLKREIKENSGGGGSGGLTPVITMLKSAILRGVQSINETFSYEVTESGFLIVTLNAMTEASITLTLNDVPLVFAIDDWRKYAGAFLPVYPGDAIEFSCISEGADENLVVSIALLTGLEVPDPPTPPINNNEKKGD